MASNLQLISGSPLIGSPIVYEVTAGSPVGTVSFQRVKIYVLARLSTEQTYRRYELSQPVSKGETVEIDIGSALRAVADSYEYTSDIPASYPYVRWTLEACDEYMQNGQNSGDVGVVTNEGGRALMGSFSDLERLRAAQAGRKASRFTRKPSSSPEIVFVGSTFLHPQQMTVGITDIYHGQIVDEATVTSEGSQNLFGVTVYAVPFPTDGYEIRFINGLGAMESVCVKSLTQEEVNYKTTDYVVAHQELFNQVSRNDVLKSGDQERLKLSSGPVDRLWQQWYLHEMLMARHAWVKVDSMWVPCHIMPEETVSGLNRVDGKPLEVQFALRLDISGSPYAALAI